MDDTGKILQRIIQAGVVQAVDREKRMARVKHPITGIISGWLYVLDNRSFIPDYDGVQQTEEASGGMGEAAFAAHSHELIILPWMPKVNDTVLCLYLPYMNSDGFILGRIGK